jgi:hypothetical protein
LPRMPFKSILTITALITVSLAGLANSQEFQGSLTGRVSDSTGAAVGGARVVGLTTATKSSSETITDDNGDYTLPFLQPGQYVVTIDKLGFRRSVQQGVKIDVAVKTNLDVSLEVGDLKQAVEVMADVTVVESESANRGLTIDSQRVEDTALQGRNIMAGAWSSPGVAVTAAGQRLRPFDGAGSSGMSINGGRTSGNEVLIDGISNINPNGTTASYVPSVESTAEFRVQTTMFDAQYGWTTGGVVNIVTKSGSNDFHGFAYEFLQNTHLDANTWQSNLNGVPRQSSHINTFGGGVGGPVKRNKVFFFFNTENLRQVIPDPFVTSVPTALQRSGDFSQTYYGSANGVPQLQTIYNPFTTVTNSSGTPVRSAFAGNIIPASLLNPVAVKVLGLVPLGNTAGTAITGLNNLSNNGSSRKFTDFFPEYLGRGDYNLSDVTKIFVRYSQSNLSEARGFHYSTNTAIDPAETSTNAPFTRNSKSATAQLTHTFNPTTLFEFRAGIFYFISNSGSLAGQNYDLSSLGFSPTFVAEAAKFFPKFNWSNYEGAGSNPYGVSPASQVDSFQPSLSKTVGRETIKIGGEVRLQKVNTQSPGYSAGNFTFDNLFTGQNPLVGASSSGNSIASFLLGTPASGYIDNNIFPARKENLVSVYLQDDIHVSQRLTVNAGLRWDYEGPMTDRHNELTRGFDTSAASPLQVPGYALKGGLLYAGAQGQPEGAYNKYYRNFGPRLGFAYRLGNKTVLRGGYALFYGLSFNDPGNAPGYNVQTPLVTNVVAGVPGSLLTNPFPNGLLASVGNSLGLATNLGQSLSVADVNSRIPLVQQFSFEIQRELFNQFLGSVSYVGSHSSRLPVNQNIDALTTAQYALGSAALIKSVPNPFAGRLPGTSLNGATVQAQQLLLPYPQYAGTIPINNQFESIGKSQYNSLQLLLQKRLGSGLDMSVAYTFSKTMDRTNFANAQDTQLEKVVAPWDVRNSLQINSVYQLPFGKGKRFGAGLPSVPKFLVSGWTISGLARIQTGLPMPFPTNAAPTGVNPALSDPTLQRWFNACTLLANGGTQNCVGNEQPAWTYRQPFTLQTWSTRLDSVRLPPIRNLDASVIKNNRIGERLNIVFRTDFINATNTAQWFSFASSTLDATSPNFGKVAGVQDQSNLPRFIQFSLRAQF